DRAQLVEREATHAAIAAGEEALRGGQFRELVHPARAELAAQADVPGARRDRPDPLRVAVEAQVRGVGTERLRTAGQLDVIGGFADPAGQEVRRQARIADAGDQQQVRALRAVRE